ncbi:hypothetical protein [Phytohabitans kaempferiae]|uniref:JAB domain-containing protein n=1 Tax=Phytohabitans kaempferiae TaxID=1620943 RepID=A0ABV6MFB1_9ACTN
MNPRLPRVTIDMAVAARFAEEIHRNPDIEVGGKYIGFVHGPARLPTLGARHEVMSSLAFEVVDYIDAGPGASRSDAHHYPDRDYQLRRFREIERMMPAIEHLGSWHSHHPNGVRNLSDRDLDGYFWTVNNQDHNHDFFLASLAVDETGFNHARHFLFVRGDQHYYEIPLANIELVSDASSSRRTPPQAEETTLDVPGWTDNAIGRSQLARDREFVFRRLTALKYGITSGRVTLTGTVHAASGVDIEVKMVYPSRVGGDDGLLKIRTLNPPSIEFILEDKYAVNARSVQGAIVAVDLWNWRATRAAYVVAFQAMNGMQRWLGLGRNDRDHSAPKDIS